MTNEEKVLIKSILDMNLSTYDTAISVAEAIKKTTEQQILEKACEYLRTLKVQEFPGAPMERVMTEEDIATFKQAMEE